VDQAVEACVEVSDEIAPDPRWAAFYEDGYAEFRELYPALSRLGALTPPRGAERRAG
jgi:hypothetical protein